MKKALVFYVLFLLAFNCYAIAQEKRSQAIQEESSAFIPAAWLGNWRGEVTPQSTSGDGDKFQMELEVAPLPEKDRVKWKITYRGAQGESVRDYQLLADKNKAGHYVIDEGNGIRIPATLLGNTLQSHFSIGGQTIWTCYELVNGEPNSLVFELVTADDKQPVMSGGEKDTPQVTGLVPTSRQVARLVRQSETPKLSGGNATLVQWQKLNTDRYRGKQDDIYFVNDRVGWYGNGAGKIYKTDDGGQTWIKQLDQAGTYFRCLAFIDEQHGFAGNIGPGYFPNVSDTNPLYETKDSGQTWSAVRSIEGKPVVGLCAMQVLREEYINAGKLDTRIRLIGVGRVGGPTALIVSDDLGKTWQQLDLSNQGAMAFDVHFFNRSEGIIASATDNDVAKSNAAILRTSDGGATWERVYQSNRPYELTWKIAFPSRDTGYVTIQSYNPDATVDERFVAKTTDGGKSWKELPLVKDASVREFGIAFLDESLGWVGAMPHGFITEDGGAIWAKAEIGNAVNKIRLIKHEGKVIGYAIGTEVHKLMMNELPPKQ